MCALEDTIVVGVLFDYIKFEVRCDALGRCGKKHARRLGLCQRPVKSLAKNPCHLIQDCFRNLQPEYAFLSKIKNATGQPSIIRPLTSTFVSAVTRFTGRSIVSARDATRERLPAHLPRGCRFQRPFDRRRQKDPASAVCAGTPGRPHPPIHREFFVRRELHPPNSANSGSAIWIFLASVLTGGLHLL